MKEVWAAHVLYEFIPGCRIEAAAKFLIEMSLNTDSVQYGMFNGRLLHADAKKSIAEDIVAAYWKA